MNQYLSILAEALESSKMKWDLFETRFTTSADVVIEASGLRLEAIRVIAREQGVEIEDTACRCIGESLLAALADAHVRKLRAYLGHTSIMPDDTLPNSVATSWQRSLIFV